MHERKLGDLLPEGGFAGDQERILSGVPAEKMRRTCVRGVVLARFPDFMQEKLARQIRGTVQIVLQTAFFPAGRRNQRAQLRFQKQFLAFLSADNHSERHRVLGEFRDPRAFKPSVTGPAPRASLRFSFGHIGGDCTPSAAKSNGEF